MQHPKEDSCITARAPDLQKRLHCRFLGDESAHGDDASSRLISSIAALKRFQMFPTAFEMSMILSIFLLVCPVNEIYVHESQDRLSLLPPLSSTPPHEALLWISPFTQQETRNRR